MPFPIVITPQMLLYLTLTLDNALAMALNTVGKMSEEEIATETAVEEAKKQQLMSDVDSH